MHAPTEYGLAMHVNDLSTCPSWSHVNQEVLGFPKRPHLPPLDTDLPKNNIKATMIDAKYQKREERIYYTMECYLTKKIKLNYYFIKNPLKVPCVVFVRILNLVSELKSDIDSPDSGISPNYYL